MYWKIFKEKLSEFLDEGKQFTIIVLDRRKIWFTAGIASLIILSIIFFQDGIELWKKANLPSPTIANESSWNRGVSGANSNTSLEDRPKEIAIVDMSESHSRFLLETELQRINEPLVFGSEIIYSGGESSTIDDQAILTELFIYDMETREETSIAKSEINFGEIFEGRFNEKWVAWLDTNHIGDNIIYGMNRETGEIMEIKSCEHNRPQLRLWGDNLVWVEQGDLESDSLYLYNFRSGEPVVLDVFDNPTYGTCPPAIWEDVIIWSAPGEDGKSIIKKMNLKESEGLATEATDPEYIDPKGFAIYPSTNGEAIAWIDNLDPQKATLKLTLDGNKIIDVAEGIGRFFGVGDNFICYTRDNNIMIYFWEDGEYAHINSKEVDGRLSQCSVSGKYIVWYSNSPKESQDIVNISMIE